MYPKKAIFLFTILDISSLLHLARSNNLMLDVKLVHGILNIFYSRLQMSFLKTRIYVAVSSKRKTSWHGADFLYINSIKEINKYFGHLTHIAI